MSNDHSVYDTNVSHVEECLTKIKDIYYIE